MNARDLIEGEAELDDESADESFDEVTGEVRRKTNGTNGHLDDSSEEESEDDEEEARKVRLLIISACFSAHLLTDTLSRFVRGSLSRMRKNQKSGRDGNANERNVDEKSAKKRKQV